MNKEKFKLMGTSRMVSQLCAALGAITLIVYCIYGFVYDYFDIVVFLSMLLGIGFAQIYVMIEKSEFANLISVACFSFGLGLFFLNSYPVWADRLNNITMYGSRGTLFPVISIIILTILCILMEIISCFVNKRGEADK